LCISIIKKPFMGSEQNASQYSSFKACSAAVRIDQIDYTCLLDEAEINIKAGLKKK
jgi:hypothetical protein